MTNRRNLFTLLSQKSPAKSVEKSFITKPSFAVNSIKIEKYIFPPPVDFQFVLFLAVLLCIASVASRSLMRVILFQFARSLLPSLKLRHGIIFGGKNLKISLRLPLLSWWLGRHTKKRDVNDRCRPRDLYFPLPCCNFSPDHFSISESINL